MKEQLIGKNLKLFVDVGRLQNRKGFATLEILIAFTILILCMGSVIIVVFGNQSMAIDLETNNEAISKAEKNLEAMRALSRQDFNSVNSSTGTEVSGPLTYNKNIIVEDLTQCKKKVISDVTWTNSIRPQKVELSTFLSDITGAFALGGDCVTEPPTTNWTNPQSFASTDINPGGNQGTGLDAMKVNGNKYVFLTSTHTATTSNDFWSFNLEVNPPTIIGQLNTGVGLNAVDVAKDVNTNEIYAYVVQNSNTNQLQIINITNPATPTVVTSRTLPNIIFTCSPAASPCLAGQSIFFYDGKVYIGTKYIANLAIPISQNNEFHVYCVSDTSILGCNPSNPIWLGSFNVNHNINSINITGDKAYLATSGDNQELTILNITNPANITSDTLFDADGAEDGTSVNLLGNKIYLGRKQTASGRPELYILKKSDLSIISGKDLNLNPSNALVAGISLASNFIFLGTSDSGAEFQVWNSNNLNTIWSDFNFPQAIAGIEFLDDKIYLAVKSNNALHVIYDQP
ncbi:MAG: hypothetical protein AAB510_00595 [Patescibacteria group bacterium]